MHTLHLLPDCCHFSPLCLVPLLQFFQVHHLHLRFYLWLLTSGGWLVARLSTVGRLPWYRACKSCNWLLWWWGWLLGVDFGFGNWFGIFNGLEKEIYNNVICLKIYNMAFKSSVLESIVVIVLLVLCICELCWSSGYMSCLPCWKL